MSRDKLGRTVDFINQHITVPGKPLNADQIFVEGFLPQTPIKPQGRLDAKLEGR